MFRTNQIAVAHQRHPVIINTNDSVHHIPRAIRPCQHHVANVYWPRLMQDDALLSSDDKRQHAVSTYGQCYAYSFLYQPDGFLYDLMIRHNYFIFT